MYLLIIWIVIITSLTTSREVANRSSYFKHLVFREKLLLGRMQMFFCKLLPRDLLKDFLSYVNEPWMMVCSSSSNNNNFAFVTYLNVFDTGIHLLLFSAQEKKEEICILSLSLRISLLSAAKGSRNPARNSKIYKYIHIFIRDYIEVLLLFIFNCWFPFLQFILNM